MISVGTGEILLATGWLNLDRDLVRAGRLGVDGRLFALGGGLNSSVLDGDLGVGWTGGRLSADSRGVGDGLETTLQRPSTGTRSLNVLVGSILTAMMLAMFWTARSGISKWAPARLTEVRRTWQE